MDKFRTFKRTAKKYSQRLLNSRFRFKNPKRVFNKIFKRSTERALLLNKSLKFIRANSQSLKMVDVKYTLDANKPIMNFEGSLDLPTTISKNLTIAALVQPGINRQPYFESGADIVGADDLVFQIGRKTVKFDQLFTTTDMIPNLSRVEEELESNGLMPLIERDTLVEDLNIKLENFRKGRISFSINEFGNIIVPIGHLKLSDIELAENFLVVDSAIKSLISTQDNSINKIELSCYKGVSIQIRDPEQESKLSQSLILVELNIEELILRTKIGITKLRTARTKRRIAYLKARQAKIDALVKRLKAKEKARKEKAQKKKEIKQDIAISNLNSKNKSLFKLVTKVKDFLISKKARKEQKIKENLNETDLNNPD